MKITYTIDENTELTKEQIDMIEEAKKYPINFDEDSPELTPEMEKDFLMAAQARKARRQTVTIPVSESTYKKLVESNINYQVRLGKFIDSAIAEGKLQLN